MDRIRIVNQHARFSNPVDMLTVSLKVVDARGVLDHFHCGNLDTTAYTEQPLSDCELSQANPVATIHGPNRMNRRFLNNIAAGAMLALLWGRACVGRLS